MSRRSSRPTWFRHNFIQLLRWLTLPYKLTTLLPRDSVLYYLSMCWVYTVLLWSVQFMDRISRVSNVAKGVVLLPNPCPLFMRNPLFWTKSSFDKKWLDKSGTQSICVDTYHSYFNYLKQYVFKIQIFLVISISVGDVKTIQAMV